MAYPPNNNSYNDPEDDTYNDLDDGIEIHADTFDNDFDEINFDGEVDDDSDEDAAEMFDF